ncbi:hypothetical protein J3998_00430 [Thiomicrorhabdus sp. 6S2-11]|uniref:DUF2520 domain-containing protein n=1 Tax=Thiomicrorhabdus marina TaxID=2818442 RepID=A0ABS3Q1G3_9GAMM|nr:hypothetical protein [Thiomicrorhabdus marina]MBO1926028.1 hypothetical protein [Thiomicrorhabdus marina]
MKNPIIVVGLGELGSVFARGFLRLGYPVQGAMRGQDLQALAKDIPNPEAVLIAVGEADISSVLQDIPNAWQDRLILLQNELLPRDWQAASLPTPTVISVWFEKKKGMDSKVVIPSPIFGTKAKLVFDALAKVDLPSYIVDSEEELLYELVRKNLYILTTNIAGLEVGGNVQQLQQEHAEVMNAVAHDILEIQAYLTGQTHAIDNLIKGMLEAFAGDPEHGCMGRSAPARLKRALTFADQANLEVAKLREIAKQAQ